MLFVWLLVALITMLVTFILPESFSSTTRIKIERDRTDISGLADPGTVNTYTYDPYFIQTELELIQSEVILGKVIEDLDLNRKWGKRYAGGDRLRTTETILLLKNRLEVRLVRNTSIIDIRVFSETPEEAAYIANAIAEVYRKHRQDQRRELARGGLRALEERFQAQEQSVRAAQANVDSLRKELEQEVGTVPTNDIVTAAHSRPYFEAKRNLEELLHFRQMLAMKIASEQINAALPATSMAEIVDTAKPWPRPVRPNKPLNIAIGIVVGGIGGVFLATLVYVLQRRAFRRISGVPRTQFPPRFRAIVHILIALVVGVVVGYHCANPLDLTTIIVVPLTLLLGGIASAYTELANPRLAPQSVPAPGQVKPKDAAF